MTPRRRRPAAASRSWSRIPDTRRATADAQQRLDLLVRRVLGQPVVETHHPDLGRGLLLVGDVDGEGAGSSPTSTWPSPGAGWPSATKSATSRCTSARTACAIALPSMIRAAFRIGEASFWSGRSGPRRARAPRPSPRSPVSPGPRPSSATAAYSAVGAGQHADMAIARRVVLGQRGDEADREAGGDDAAGGERVVRLSNAICGSNPAARQSSRISPGEVEEGPWTQSSRSPASSTSDPPASGWARGENSSYIASSSAGRLRRRRRPARSPRAGT